jgi:hypothetical protein
MTFQDFLDEQVQSATQPQGHPFAASLHMPHVCGVCGRGQGSHTQTKPVTYTPGTFFEEYDPALGWVYKQITSDGRVVLAEEGWD